MRYLEHAVADQIRFGWLTVIVGLVGTRRLKLPELGKALLSLTPQFERWMQDSGLEGAPRGNARESAVEPLARMGVTFGVYNESTERLTDLGHVFHQVSGWTPKSKKTPFSWSQPQKFIGLRLLLEGAGDVVLAVLRCFPKNGVVDGDASLELIKSALSDVRAKAAARHEMERLDVQIERCKGRTARVGVLYPYVEPLRDLGYVEHRENGGRSGYRLTKEGMRLRAALADAPSAEAMIRRGLSRVFLEAEGIADIYPADSRILHTILQTLPAELTVSDTEAPLEPICLLAQVRLLEDQPGAWIDPSLAHKLIRNVGARIDGRLFLKSGHAMTDFPNVAWTGDIFDDPQIWDVGVDEPFDTMQSPQDMFFEHENAPGPVNTTSSTRVTDGGVDVVESNKDDSVLDIAAAPPRPPTPQPGDIVLLRDRSTTNSFRLWVQYVAALLEQPELGRIDLPRWGGFETGLVHLRGLMDIPDDILVLKRRRWSRFDGGGECASPGWVPIERALKSVPNTCADATLVRRVKDQWEIQLKDDKPPRTRPVAAVERAITSLPGVDAVLRKEIVEFVKKSDPDWKAWLGVREATRCLIQDALSAGRWWAHELRSHWAARINAQLDCHLQVDQMLVDLGRQPLKFEYSRSTTLGKESWLVKQLVAIKDRTTSEVKCRMVDDDLNDAVDIELAVVIEARSPTEARIKGQIQTDFFLTTELHNAPPAHRDRDIHLDLRSWTESLRDAETEDEVTIDVPNESLPLDVFWRELVQSSTETLDDVFQRRRKAVDRMHSAGDTLIAEQRISRAWHGLVVARHPLRSRSSAERLALAWSAIEQLSKSGQQGKGDTVYPLAAAATILHVRGEVVGIYCDAMGSLWSMVLLDPNHVDARGQFDKWLPALRDTLADLQPVARSIIMHRWNAATLPKVNVPRDEQALLNLFEAIGEIRRLREVIMPVAPLASSKLYMFEQWFVDDPKKVPGVLGGGKMFAEHLRECYEDFVAFFLHVYELRNRFVHDGDGFGGSNDIGLSHIVERFITIIEPIVAALSNYAEKGYSIEYFWSLAEDIYRDWHAHKKDAALTIPRIRETLFTL